MEITNLPPSMLPPLLPNHTWWLPRQVSWTTVPNWQQMKHHQRTPQQRRSSLRRMWNYFAYHDTTYMRLVETAPYIFLYSYMMIWSLWSMKLCQSQQRRPFLEPHIYMGQFLQEGVNACDYTFTTLNCLETETLQNLVWLSESQEETKSAARQDFRRWCVQVGRCASHWDKFFSKTKVIAGCVECIKKLNFVQFFG